VRSGKLDGSLILLSWSMSRRSSSNAEQARS
jgi:hypothetical protein